MNHIHCPACGWFGRKARRRARDKADAALIRFHANLARETRRARYRRMLAVSPATAEAIAHEFALGRDEQ